MLDFLQVFTGACELQTELQVEIDALHNWLHAFSSFCICILEVSVRYAFLFSFVCFSGFLEQLVGVMGVDVSHCPHVSESLWCP